MAKQDDYVRYTIRVPAALYEQLQAAAGAKSVNAEIVERLESSFDEAVPEKIRDTLRILKDFMLKASAKSSPIKHIVVVPSDTDIADLDDSPVPPDFGGKETLVLPHESSRVRDVSAKRETTTLTREELTGDAEKRLPRSSQRRQR